ncbi:MAG TPA: cytochrome c [Chthoniobacterales bacterium]|nr:cytochrome c [Chthoniobacterales bacterium]
MRPPALVRHVVACAALVALAALMLAGCGSARRSDPIKGSVTINDPRVAHGRDVWMMKCNRCHPGGEAGLGPATNDKPLPGFLIAAQIRTGLGAMPAFTKEEMSDADVAAVIAYMKAIRRADAKPM